MPLGFGLAILAVPQDSLAAAAPAPAQAPSIFSFDYGVPTSPALTLIGLSPDKTATSTTLKPFVLALPSLFGTGNQNQSAALDIAPAWVLGGSLTTFDDYRVAPYGTLLWYRMRLNTALSVGTDGGGNTKNAVASRAAIGLSASLLPESDPIRATNAQGQNVWLTCMRSDEVTKGIQSVLDMVKPDPKIANLVKAVADAQNYVTKPTNDADYNSRFEALVNAIRDLDGMLPSATAADKITALNDLINKANDVEVGLKSNQTLAKAVSASGIPDAIKTCAKEASNVAASKPKLDVGVGGVWQGDPGNLQNLKNPGTTVWTGFRLPFGSFLYGEADQTIDRFLVFGGSARYSYNSSMSTGNATTPQIQADVAEGWVGLQYYYKGGVKISGQYGYVDARAVDSGESKFSKAGSRWLLSAALKLLDSEGLWFELSYGSGNASVTTTNDKQLLFNMTVSPPDASSIFGF